MKNLIYLIVLTLLLTSCGVTKRTKSESIATSEKVEKIKDSSAVVENNKAISDEATIAIPESNTGDAELDRRVNQGVINALKGINFQKSSGDNGYRIYYDEQLRALRAEVDIAATQNKETTTNESSKEQYSVVSELKEEIKKIRVPWWAYALLVFVFRKQIIGLVGLFFPAVKGINSIQDLLTPPNKNKDGDA